MQTTFLTKYKPTLGSGQQRKLEINNHVLPAKLADEIEEKVVSHFDSIIDWSTAWFIKWTKCAGIALKVCDSKCELILADIDSGSLHLVEEPHLCPFKIDSMDRQDRTRYSITRRIRGKSPNSCLRIML